ncbi:MAG: TatD family hydrolase [Armatimonadetes bacterium]|nr:TatD family hydrolase [Armatimonadota bacterium]
MRLIDTHCHLNDTEAFPNPSEAIAEARAAGVEKLIVIGVDTESSRLAVEIAEQHEGVYATVGWHPNYTQNFNKLELAEIEKLITHPKVVAIGEIGMDFHWDYATSDEQRSALLLQLDLAGKYEKPVVFHCREAEWFLLPILEKRIQICPKERGKWLLHCFAGSQDDAKRAIELDCMFGVDGPVTYKKADELRETIQTIGLERIVIETDAPWMTPVPHRGKRNKPAWVKHVNEGLAETFDVTPEVTARITTKNAEDFFGI